MNRAAVRSPKLGSSADATVPTMKIVTSTSSNRVRDIRAASAAKTGGERDERARTGGGGE